MGVVGQKVTYSNGTITQPEEETTQNSPRSVKPDSQEAVKGLKPSKGQSAATSGLSHKNKSLIVILKLTK